MDYGLLTIWGPFLLCLGGAVGLLAGLLGVGGGILLVPGLLYAFAGMGFDGDNIMHLAVGTSLAIIIPTGMSSARAHWKRGGVRVDLLKSIGIGVIAGVAAGTIVAGALSGHALKMFFACMLMVLAVVITIDPEKFRFGDDIPRQPFAAMMGAGIGLLSTLMGIGGATISVPYMTLHRVPMKQAIGTGSALGILIACMAVIGFLTLGLVEGREEGALPPFSLGYINLLAWGLIVPASVLAAPFGARLAHRLPVATLRRIFAAFLFVVAGRMLYGLLHG